MEDKITLTRLEGLEGIITPPDAIITCKDCGEVFIFTVREQEFYKTMEFQDPCRCKECRKEAKHRRKHGKPVKKFVEGVM